MTTQFKTWYMDQAVFDLAEVIETAKDRLKDVEFDTLVGTGFSGGIVIPSLALALGKKFVLIRKDTDDSHHGKGRLVGELGERWIFVDDFIASGRTRTRVIEKVKEAKSDTGRKAHSTLVGQYMYLGWNHEKDDYGKYDVALEGDYLPGGY
jgi:orotate phosphoribosyltransferase